MRYFNKKLISIVIILSLFFGVAERAFAVEKYNDGRATDDGLASEGDAGKIINTVISYATAILAGLFVLMMLIGSIMYMVYTDSEKKQKGMVLIQSAIIAAIIALLSYALWKIMQNILVSDSGGGGGGSVIR